MKSRLLRTASVLFAALTGGLCLPLLNVSAAEEEYTEASNESFYYEKYSDHIVITGGKNDPDTLEIPAQIDGLPVTGIGMYAFQLSKMSTLKLPDTLKVIDMYAFGYCENLKSLTIPDSVESILLRAFESCKALTEINFPDHLVKTGEFIFDDTPWLEAQRKISPLVIVNGALVDARTATGDVVVPSSVKYVSGSAFAGSGMEPNTKLTSVVIPSTAKEYGPNVFWYCTNLKSAELAGVTELDFGVFGSCSQLTDLKLSGNLKSIDLYTFCDNDATATITFYGSESTWNKVEKPADDGYLQRARYVFDENHQDDPPEDEEVIGDINMDGKCDLTDAVLLSKWLQGESDTELKNWKAGDLNGDGALKGNDLTLLKRIFIGK